MDPRLTEILQSQGSVPEAPSFVGPSPEDTSTFAASTPGAARQNVLRTALQLNDPESFGSKVFKVLGMLSSNEAPGMPGPLQGILAGVKAARAPTKTLQAAIKAEREGLPSQEIWRKYGWERGADKKWRWEIPDDAAKLTAVAKDYVARDPRTKGYPPPLSSMLEHPALLKNYPELGQLGTTLHKAPAEGSFSPSSDFARSRVDARGMTDEELKSSLLHELQHGIQAREGFASGGSPATVPKVDINRVLRSARGPEDLRDPEMTAYKRLAGETEARNVEGRLGNPDLRKLAPSVTEDVPRLLQIVRAMQGGKNTQMSVHDLNLARSRKLWMSSEYRRKSMEDYKRLEAESKTNNPVKLQDIRTGAEFTATEPWEKEVAKQMILIMNEMRSK